MLGTVYSALQKRGFIVSIADTKEDALTQALDGVPETASIGWGASASLLHIGLLDHFRASKTHEVYDKLVENMDMSDRVLVQNKAMHADYYYASANAVTKDGDMVFIDHSNDRIAPILFGPLNVVLIVGINKLVESIEIADMRTRMLAKNIATAQGLDTPCAKNIYGCAGCVGQERVCSTTVVLHQPPGGAMHNIKIILVKEEVGY